MTRNELLKLIHLSYKPEKISENISFSIENEETKKQEHFGNKHIVAIADQNIWIQKPPNYYYTTHENLELSLCLMKLLTDSSFNIIHVPFYIEVSKSNRHFLFPNADEKDLVYSSKQSGVGKHHPQDFCLLGIKEFYTDLFRFDQNTVSEVQKSIYSDSRFVYDPYYIHDDILNLFIKASAGLSDPDNNVLENKWNVLKLTEHCCKYVEQNGVKVSGGLLTEQQIFDYIFKKAGKDYSPEFIKNLSHQVYFEQAYK